MGLNKKQLKEAPKLLYGFRGRKIEPFGSMSLPVSFGSPTNARTEYISFDIVDMSYAEHKIEVCGLTAIHNRGRQVQQQHS
jgi:hypothetical protein